VGLFYVDFYSVSFVLPLAMAFVLICKGTIFFGILQQTFEPFFQKYSNLYDFRTFWGEIYWGL